MSISAAVAFDATARMFSVIADRKLLEGIEQGALIDVDGKQMTVLELCKTVTDAKAVCDEKKAAINDAMLVHGKMEVDGIIFDGDSIGETTQEESTYSGEVTPDTTMECASGSNERDSSQNGQMADLLEQYEHDQEMKQFLENLADDLKFKIIRDCQQHREVTELLVRRYGTRTDGAIVNEFSHLNLPKNLNQRSLLEPRPSTVADYGSASFFDNLIALDNQRSSLNGRSVPTKRTYVDNGEDDIYNPPPKRNNHIGRALPTMRYPFLSREEEEAIFRKYGHSASSYSQMIGKVLFQDSLNKYFKDQDPKRRDWMHEAVDYRFPSDDKSAQILKWKNCSNAINKNMREKEKERQEVDKSRARELDYKFISRDVEQGCYEKANGDPVKYAEAMALILFHKTVDKFFKEQDPRKKDWLRDCVDRRFYLHDKDKRDQRWKICAAACNKNRTKVISADGKEDPFPYFSKEIEEECYQSSGDVPSVYCEAMCRHLFPDTQHLLFKDQDIGRRNWLHQVLDRRFPTPDKIQQIAKWKSCTSAVNKYKNADDSSMTNDSFVSQSSQSDKKENVLVTPRLSVKDEKPSVSSSRADRSERRKEELKKDDWESGSVQSLSSKRTRRSVLDKEEATPTTVSPSVSLKAGLRARPKKTVLPYTSYPFLTEDEEMEILEKANGNPQVYARAIGRVLFKGSLKLYYKDQEPPRRQWMREIVDFRFPTPDAGDQKQKWKNVTAAINKNMTLR